MRNEHIRRLDENIFESTNAEIKTTLNDIVDDTCCRETEEVIGTPVDFELDEQLLGYLNDLIEEKFYRPLWKARAQPKEMNYE